eukprot:500293-Amphidinium_carterae.1
MQQSFDNVVSGCHKLCCSAWVNRWPTTATRSRLCVASTNSLALACGTLQSAQWAWSQRSVDLPMKGCRSPWRSRFTPPQTRSVLPSCPSIGGENDDEETAQRLGRLLQAVPGSH